MSNECDCCYGTNDVQGPEYDRRCADCRTEDDKFNDDWKREQATQLGMGLGIDAYNDAMGYGAGYPDEDPDDPYYGT